jgi:hypothetical protein
MSTQTLTIEGMTYKQRRRAAKLYDQWLTQGLPPIVSAAKAYELTGLWHHTWHNNPTVTLSSVALLAVKEGQ